MEAILTAASEFAKEKGYDRVPVTLAITNQYDHWSQSVNDTCTRRWDIGLKLFRASIEIPAGAFPNVGILIHLDHAQHDSDAEMLEYDLSMYSSASSQTGDKASLQHFTTTTRQEIVFNEMKWIARGYLDLWYR